MEIREGPLPSDSTREKSGSGRGVYATGSWRLPPEVHVAFFGFLLNYPWEMLQTPFFAGMTEMRHWDAVRECSWAALGDAGLLVAAFWLTAAMERSRGWMRHPRPQSVAVFMAAGLIATVVVEWLATNQWDRWQYADRMPTLPGLGTGLAPVLQWLVLPPLLIWVVRRQLHGSGALASALPGTAADEEVRSE